MKSAPVDEDQLCRDYEAGMGERPLATAYHISRNRVRTILDAHGIVRRPSGIAPLSAPQPTQLEVEARVKIVADMLVAGVTDWRVIVKHGNEKLGWGVQPDAVYKYMTRARALLRETTEQEDADRRALQWSRLDLLWREAPDTRTKLDVVREGNKLGGLYPATKTELTGKDGGEIVLYIPDNGRRTA